MLKPVLIVGALALLATAGVVEGLRSNRWGATEDVKAAAAKLDGVPREFGPWVSTESPIEQRILDKAEAIGSVSRVYRNRNSGTELSVLLLCGPSGPIGAHTPDICYAGLGYKMIGGEISKPVKMPDGSTPTYWSGRFEKDAKESGLIVSWAWSTDGNWVASPNARRDFLLHNVLYKLYVSRGLTAAERDHKPAAADPTQDFLTDFLPEVKKALAPPA